MMRFVRLVLLGVLGLCGMLAAHATGFSSDVTIELTCSHHTLRTGQTETEVTFDIQVNGLDRVGTVDLVRVDTGEVVATCTTDVTGHAAILTHLGQGIIPDAFGTYQFLARGHIDGTTDTVSSLTETVAVTTAEVVLTIPTNGITYLTPASIPLTAELIACDGLTIDKIELYQGTTLIATVTSAPYTTTWTGMPCGVYTLTAKAYVHLGGTLISDPVVITVSNTSILTEHPALDQDPANTGDRWGTAISADGRYVVFVSDDADLVFNDTNGVADVFVYDRQASTIERVSIGTGNIEANGESYDVAISQYGRYVIFSSLASNLVAGDTNGQIDVFVRDRQAGTTTRVSVATDGTQANGPCWGSSVSANGQWVAFLADATTLVNDGQNGYCGLFVRDLATGTTQRLLTFQQGNQLGGGTAISADGTIVAFSSDDPMLDSGDTNEARDVYVVDRQTLARQRVSLSSFGVQGDADSWAPSISSDARYVAFVSVAITLDDTDTNEKCDVFVRDRLTGTTNRIATPEGNDHSWEAQISANGRYVIYTSDASNLVGDTNHACDIFRYDTLTDTQVRLVRGPGGVESNGDSWDLAVSADGQTVAYTSVGTNLTTPETDGHRELYVAGVTTP